MNVQHDSKALQQNYEVFYEYAYGGEGRLSIGVDYQTRLNEAVIALQTYLRYAVALHLERPIRSSVQLEDLVSESFKRLVDHCVGSEKVPSCEALLDRIAEQTVLDPALVQTQNEEGCERTEKQPKTMKDHWESVWLAVNDLGRSARQASAFWPPYKQAIDDIRTYFEIRISHRVISTLCTKLQLEILIDNALDRLIEWCRRSTDLAGCEPALEQIAGEVADAFMSKLTGRGRHLEITTNRSITLSEHYECISSTLCAPEASRMDEKVRARFDQALTTIRTVLEFAIDREITDRLQIALPRKGLVEAALGRISDGCCLHQRPASCEQLLNDVAREVVEEFLSKIRAIPPESKHSPAAPLSAGNSAMQQSFDSAREHSGPPRLSNIEHLVSV